MSKELRLCSGAAIRLIKCMTYWSKPLDYTQQKHEEAKRILERWLKACTLTEDGPPIEILECLTDNLNTPKMVTLMHQYRKEDGKKLFATMRFLGFFEEKGSNVTSDLLTSGSEVKTLPEDYEQETGPDCMYEA